MCRARQLGATPLTLWLKRGETAEQLEQVVNPSTTSQGLHEIGNPPYSPLVPPD